MTAPRNIKALPVSQLSDDELSQRLEGEISDLKALTPDLPAYLAPTEARAKEVSKIRESIGEIEAEQRYRRETRDRQATLAVSQSTLKVYKVLVWLTVILAVGTVAQVLVAIFKR
jgi:hypothetical protein